MSPVPRTSALTITSLATTIVVSVRTRALVAKTHKSSTSHFVTSCPLDLVAVGSSVMPVTHRGNLKITKSLECLPVRYQNAASLQNGGSTL
ncbi:hypothetical protein EX30DRAFT_341491 [Ascodesmis nigricans]|uniref:Uncharacterized protein n=1 Tax=Ascodesmis nigricans TaxID=341454 RepID=A0A4V3SIL5_9PEZI|nr:hypothetical protein EX30DRAFT_341491 [Ascodesmis nigricans]